MALPRADRRRTSIDPSARPSCFPVQVHPSHYLTQPVDFSKTCIAAVFVFHDPRNWSLDIQLTLDVVRSRGVLGAPYAYPADGARPPVELVFCNPDLLWTSDFPRPRLGQGAFREAFQAVYKVRGGLRTPRAAGPQRERG